MKRIVTILSVITALLLLFPLLSATANKFVISVQNYSFTPATISEVAVGDTIHWDWIEGSHTTTSTVIPSGAATWNSPLTSTSTSFEYKVTTAGVYNYKCTPHASMGMVGSFTASLSNGITENPAFFGSLKISPNPANEKVYISFSPPASFKGFVLLRNLFGNTMWKSEYDFGKGLNFLEINLANIPEGLYFIELSDNVKNRAVRKLVIE